LNVVFFEKASLKYYQNSPVKIIVSALKMNSPSSLSAWLHYLETRHSESIQLGLDRVRVVAMLLGLTSFDAVVITVAGTNGKGSTVAALNAIYRAAGYSVGSYTSPHLLAFNERICMNQVQVTDDDLCDAFHAIHAVPASQTLTYFEMATLAAFWIFKKQRPDVILLEVGMGGRLDATNLIDADLSIISTIDFDHQAWLGHTRDAIGYEKAGILRPGKHAIYADINPPASIRTYARDLGVAMLCLGEDYRLQEQKDGFELQLHGATFSFPKPSLNLKAVGAALVATMLLQNKLPIGKDSWSIACRYGTILGRQQCIDGPIKTVLDVAHNPQSVALLADFMETQARTGRVHAVFSGLKDKDLCGLISPMQSIVDAWYPALLKCDRAPDEAWIRGVFLRTETMCSTVFSDPSAAYRAAMNLAVPGDWVVVYGSFLTVGAVIAADLMEERG
jgi:dihydrofolate synthase/folylpolyglutamate synthase